MALGFIDDVAILVCGDSVENSLEKLVILENPFLIAEPVLGPRLTPLHLT